MHRYGALFPGQGSQYKQMAKHLIEAYPWVNRLLNTASEIVGWDMESTILHGDMKTLTQSHIAQPCVVAISYVFFKEYLYTYGEPDYLMGHSLGEVSAALASGMISFEAGMEFVKGRSQLMEAIRAQNQSFSGVILDLDLETVQGIMREMENEAGHKTCAICAYNAPTQFMVGGLKIGEKKLDQLVHNHEGQYVPFRMIPMRANVAYHSQWMEPFAKDFEALVAPIHFSDPKYPIISTIENTIVTQGAHGKALLGTQLSRPVLWTQALRTLQASGVQRAVEIGPGATMSQLVKEHEYLSSVTAYDEKKSSIV